MGRGRDGEARRKGVVAGAKREVIGFTDQAGQPAVGQKRDPGRVRCGSQVCGRLLKRFEVGELQRIGGKQWAKRAVGKSQKSDARG